MDTFTSTPDRAAPGDGAVADRSNKRDCQRPLRCWQLAACSCRRRQRRRFLWRSAGADGLGTTPATPPVLRIQRTSLVLGPVQAVKQRPWILDVPAATGFENALRSPAQSQQSLGRQLRSLPFDPLQHAGVGLVAIGWSLRRCEVREEI